MAEWTAAVEEDKPGGDWCVRLYRNGHDVFMFREDGSSFVRRFMRRKRAEKVAREDLEAARKLDRAPYRVQQRTHDYKDPWNWTPPDWIEPTRIEIR